MKISRIKRENLRPGMCISDDIYGLNGILVAAKDSIVDERMMTMLERYHIGYINIQRDSNLESGQMPGHIVTEEFHASFDKIQKDIRTTFQETISAETEMKMEDMTDQIDNLMEEAGNSYDLLNMLLDMGKESDATYQHAIQVSMLSSVLGRWLDFTEREVTLLGIAGLFHDIGKCRIDPKILNKEGKLTKSEYEAVRRHVIIGYKIMKNKNIDVRVKQAVLAHHERCDGSGYPLGIQGKEIGEFARIVAIADVYAAMTEKRTYRERSYSPFEAVSYLEREGLGKFDSKYLFCFLSHILNSYLHRRVEISNGMTGEIVFINNSNLSRPLIKTSTGYLDMSLRPELSVVEML